VSLYIDLIDCIAAGVQIGGPFSKTVDLFNSATGAWSVAELSVARYQLAATSIGDLAIFAGGLLDGGALCWTYSFFGL
jgi:hypothetical protein